MTRLPEMPLSRLSGLLLLAFAGPLLVWQMVPGNQEAIPASAFLALHSLAEIFAVVVAALVFYTGYGMQPERRSTRAVLLSHAFLAVALLDTLHLLSYPGMPDLISANSAHKAILFWLGARVMAGVGLLAYVLLPESRTLGRAGQRLFLIGMLGGVAVLGALFTAMPQQVPSTFVEGAGLSSPKVALEWGVFALYLGTAATLYARRQRVTHCDVFNLGLALLLMAAAELFFTLYVSVNSTANMLGHAYKVAAYYFLYLAIYGDAVDRPFRQMRHMLTYDDLTGLPNRAAFGERLGEALGAGHAPGGAVLLLDLDNFKDVNDTLGHERGDQLLVAAAGRIRKALPESAYLARFSGDEFVALLEGVTRQEASGAGQTLLGAMRDEFELGEDRLAIGISLGMVLYPDDGDSPSELMRHADLALHRAKSSGRNCLVGFDRELSRAIRRRVLLEARLRYALQNGELSLHYQPKLALGGGRLAGCEALLRWNSPELGAVGPDEFVPVAEQSGLILPIGDWVVREACRQLRAWKDQGLDIGVVAVNLSTRQFRQSDLADEIGRALRDSGLAPGDLELELTESAIMDNLAAAAGVLGELGALGVRIAVDDFGTGYSSLAYLKSFPLHSLKIDRSFIRDIPGDENDTAIVRTIIALAGNLGLSVVAEGVETPAQLDYLRSNRCDQIQGYLLSRPLPADQFAAWVRAGHSLVGPA